VDHSARIRSRLDEIAHRLQSQNEQPMIDVTPQKPSPSALLAAGLRGDRERE
jgi:hypothetical protein